MGGGKQSLTQMYSPSSCIQSHLDTHHACRLKDKTCQRSAELHLPNNPAFLKGPKLFFPRTMPRIERVSFVEGTNAYKAHETYAVCRCPPDPATSKILWNTCILETRSNLLWASLVCGYTCFRTSGSRRRASYAIHSPCVWVLSNASTRFGKLCPSD